MGETLAQHGTHSSNGGTNDSGEKAIEANIEERNSHSTLDAAPVKKQGGFKRHCARFWWAHLITFCVIFLIIALCLIYVALPKIAQDDVNRSHLELLELKFLEPTADGFNIQQTARLHNPSKFTPTLDGFYAASYFVDNKTGIEPEPLTHFMMPKVHAKHPSSVASVAPQRAEISNMDQAKLYTTAVVQQEYVSTALLGRTPLHLGGLPSNVIKYNTTLTYKGLNGLKGFAVEDLKLNLTAAPGTPNLKGFATFPNPSVITIGLGDVTLILSTALAGVIGSAIIRDMTIVPGPNRFAIDNTVNNTLVLQSTKNDLITLQIIGNSSVHNGQHLEYYEAALASTHLELPINVTALIAAALHPPA